MTLSLPLIFLLVVPRVDAKVPESVSKQKNAVVTIYVDDKNGNHIASGNGFIIDQTGVIVTNCHVIAKWLEEVENTLSVKGEGDVSHPLEYILFSKCRNNIALFTVEAEGLPTVKFVTDYKPRRGESIFIIGSPSELETTISEGVIRDVRRKDRLIRISIPVTQERSGSPVFNIKGEVIGAAISLTKKGQNLNVAVPLKNITKQLDRYKRHKKKQKHRAKIDAPPSLPAPSPKALTEEKEEVTKKPEDAHSFFLLGRTYDELHKYDEAIKAYQQSLSIKPDFLEAYVNLGIAHYKLCKYDDATEAYKKALQIEPHSSSVYTKLGGTYIILGEYVMAIDAFKKAVDLDPNNAAAHFDLGVAYFLNGETIVAFREYRILKDLDEERADRLIDIMYY